jgi:peptide/nickel transport system substrate-binding protein
MKKLLVALMMGALALGSVAAQAQPKDRVVIGGSLEPPVLDPSLNAASAIREITYQNIFESLGRIDADGKIVPGLADSWTISPDGKTYTFKLHAGVKFHNGEPMTAETVKFALDRLFAPDTKIPAKSLYAAIEKVEVVDPSTIKISLKAPDAFLLFNLSIADAAIVEPKSAATNGTNPIGTGPFMFKERKAGESITLVKAPTYRNPAAIKLNTIVFKFIKDPSAQINALLAGDVDAFPGFQAPELVGKLKADPRFAVVVGFTEGEVILATNNAKKPMSELKVRQAIAHAIDRKELIQAEFGFGVPIGSHYPPHDPNYVDLTKTYPYDLAAAKKLLAEAGYPNGFEATLKLPPVGYAQRAGEVMVSQLGKIGIKVSIVQLEWPQWLKDVFSEKNYDFTIVAHTEAFDIDRYQRDGYYWGYKSDAFRETYKQMIAEPDPAKRKPLLAKLQQTIAQDAVNGYLYELAKIGVWNKNLVGMWANSPTPSTDMSQVYWK